MSEELQKITIIGVEKDAIKFSTDKEEQWIVPFKLSEAPSQAWRKNFFDAQAKDSNEMKRKARIDGMLINVEVLASDDLQKVLDAIKEEVAVTNALCESDYEAKLKVRQDLANLKQRREDTTQKLKDGTDQLAF